MEKKTKILVTGANGQLGCCMRDISAFNKDYEFVFTDISELDITNENKVEEFVKRESPKWIVNCAAYNAVDKAENEVENANKLNVMAVRILMLSAKKNGAGFIHISSDYVFPGTKPEPLSEDDETGPLSIYGKTKLEGENVALQYEKSVVLRTSWLYSEYGNNFVKTMRRLAENKTEVSVVSDQWGTPTSAHDLAKAIMAVIKNPSYGLFHFSNEGLTSWALFAEEIFYMSKLDCKVRHISSEEYNSVANRPKFSILSKKKFSKTYKVDIPEWEMSLEEVIHKLDL